MNRLSLKSSIKLFGKYYRKADEDYHDFNRDLASEVNRRLDKLEFILNRILKLEQKSDQMVNSFFESVPSRRKVKKLKVKRYVNLTEEIELLTECFYYNAFRLIKILQQLPGLKNFDCAEIRNVRNKLIEHPDKEDSNVLINSFSHGGRDGPMIKRARYSHQTHIFPDKGLFFNVSKFQEKLNTKLESLLKNKKR